MKVMAVVAHPDDEVLGVGATLAKHSRQGDEVSVLILGKGMGSRPKQKQEKDKLLKSCKVANKILGVKNLFIEDNPDNAFDTVSLLSIVKTVEKYIKKIKPSIIYTHHHGDLNIDHQITFKAVLTATRPLKGSSVKSILCFETPSSTEWNVQNNQTVFLPNTYVNISQTLKTKLRAIETYETEIRKYPHPRSIKALEVLAKKRGVEAGLKFAEAFCLIKEIIK